MDNYNTAEGKISVCGVTYIQRIYVSELQAGVHVMCCHCGAKYCAVTVTHLTTIVLLYRHP